MNRIVVLAMTALVAFAAPSHSDELRYVKDRAFHYFDAAPLPELFSSKDFAKYQTFLKEENCPAAAAMLNLAFIERYPQFSNVGIGRSNFNFWYKIYVPYKYFSLHFCVVKDQLRRVEKKIVTSDKPVGFYSLRRPPPWPDGYEPLWRDRDIAVHGFITLASLDYIPGLLALANLVVRGDVIDLGRDFEFYLIKRACHLGHDCSDFKVRFSELEKLVPPEKQSSAANNAKRHNMVEELVFDRNPFTPEQTKRLFGDNPPARFKDPKPTTSDTP